MSRNVRFLNATRLFSDISRRFFVCLALVLAGFAAMGQNSVKGQVKDENGAPIPLVSVVVTGTSRFALTDSTGTFQIDAPALPVYLRLSSVGYKTIEVPVTALPSGALAITLVEDAELGEVIVTARRRKEASQEIPIPISVLAGGVVDDAGAFNVNRLKELVPTVQLYSSNPRNTTLNIRGLGSTFGLTNDGIDPGVGFYVDGVYYARPAATALDFVDIDQIEVLRGPQGTLFGKNTTAGAFNISTRPASFTPSSNFEVSYGNFGFIQAKSSVTGRIANKLAGRLSFSGTQRDGLLTNVNTQQKVNDLNNLGLRGQLLFTPSERFKITVFGDFSTQRPNGYAQVIAGVVTTKRADYRQFNNIISDFDYQLPSTNAFDRKIDHDTPWRSNNDLGGASVNLDLKIGRGTLTSTSAWRYWKWGPSNDRDFTGLPVLALSQAPSLHHQWSQEVRYAGEFSKKLSGVLGAFFLNQNLKTDPYHTEESGAAQWRFSQNSTSALWSTPGLLDGYGIRTTSELNSLSAAIFGQADWTVLKGLHVLPGIRYNLDRKSVDFNRQTYGGLVTDDPELIKLKKAVYTDQAFTVDANEGNFSGQLTVAYKPTKKINAFATYSKSFKPIGVNLGGLPTSNGVVMTELAVVKPENVNHFEIGVKTSPTQYSKLNLTVYNTDIRDFQTQVQTAEVGVNRGYLANADHVRVAGAELDGNIRFGRSLTVNVAVAYTDGKYISFPNAPVPLEETGTKDANGKDVAFKDVSGGRLPGISTWSGSAGAEYTHAAKLLDKFGDFFVAVDGFYRSEYSSSPSPSQFLNIEGYTLVNGRLGFRATEGLSLFVWSRNLLNADYYEQLLPAAGNAGQYAAVLGDPRTFGVTLRYALR